MRLSSVSIVGIALLLSACASTARTSINRENQNPLTASRYGDELADSMANIVIQDDPIAKDPAMRAVIDAQITLGKKIADSARTKQEQGMKGGLVQVKNQISGYVLYTDDMLFLSPDFFAVPAADLHIMLTTVVDPRDVMFPDKTTIDLGTIQSAYGAQQYAVPHQDKPELYRTLVLFDRKLQRIEGFAQLSK